MATISFKNLEAYELRLSRLTKNIKKIAGSAIYAGAAVMADEVRMGIESLPIVEGYGTREYPLPGGVTGSQKTGLLNGFGIAKLQEKNGYYHVKVGFDGYNQTKTEKYPQGQPNQLVARGVESGTTWKRKHPFVRPAVNRARKRTEQVMAETLDKEIGKIME